MICRNRQDPIRYELVCDCCLTAGPSAASRESALVLALETGWRAVSPATLSFLADLCADCDTWSNRAVSEVLA